MFWHHSKNIVDIKKFKTFTLFTMVFFPMNIFAASESQLPSEAFYFLLLALAVLTGAALAIIINFIALRRGLNKIDRTLKQIALAVNKETAAAIEKTEVNEEAMENNIATLDSLTRLPDRRYLFNYLQYLFNNNIDCHEKYALLIINIDFFRSVNNNLGHEIGDKVLVECAGRLKALFLENSFVARMDGDEFVIVKSIHATEDADSSADKILEAMKKPIPFSSQEVYLSVSIGISIFPDQGSSPGDIIKNAAAAVNSVKTSKRSSYRVFTPEIAERSHQSFNLHSELRQAIERNEFVLHYQPKIDSKTTHIVGIEALIRWNHPSRGLLYPLDFIPVAEETGIIKYIDEWVLYTACAQLKKWLQEGISNIRLAVNLSAWQFKDKHLVETVSRVLKDTGIAPHYLELEITETAALENLNFTQNILAKLMDMGVSISIDDFGVGYSSLNYLKHFPISFLKIDKTFIADILSDRNTYSIVKAIIDVAHTLELKVIAEGVENQEQLDLLKNLGCDEIQGYHVSKPLNVEDIKRRIQNDI